MEYAMLKGVKMNQPKEGKNRNDVAHKEIQMKEFNNILVVSRSTKHCRKAVHVGISLARAYGAKLHVLHVVHDPFNLDGWNLPLPSVHEEYLKLMNRYKKELHKIVMEEK